VGLYFLRDYFKEGAKRQKTLDAGEEAKNFKPPELSFQQYTDILE
jgi:hypothetical protein